MSAVPFSTRCDFVGKRPKASVQVLPVPQRLFDCYSDTTIRTCHWCSQTQVGMACKAVFIILTDFEQFSKFELFFSMDGLFLFDLPFVSCSR
ncbi:hypothetical protein GDO81_009844 [Engystomops pustulosus]|uniref:Uncharacterized protein n=1 Tax=Engystomops pustulosus TaxID=76066 RepID=A0AAV7BUN7_ENGPU|nr:hypothetical protein GDO81_009844 [Engystomops pustulosus]